MKHKTRQILRIVAIAALLLAVMAVTVFADDEAASASKFFATGWALLPPIIAIALALITKEVYISLFVGILTGALLTANFSPLGTVEAIANGFRDSVGDPGNAGILIFLVILGILVALMNKAGGSAAYGRWATKKIKSKTGGLLATIALGVLIFVDDYFNCLTVGSVMRPVTDKLKVSRAKLAYVIDATAAPICIIAPISSWAAAVASYSSDGFGMFVRAIPYNFYALLTLLFIVVLALMKFDYGPMKKYEKMAEEGDVYGGTGDEYAGNTDDAVNPKGKVMDLVVPVIVLIVCCIFGLMVTGGILEGASVIDAFADCDATLGLPIGSLIALVFTFVFYMIRRVVSFHEFAACIPDGFRQMVPAILILSFAWTLSGFVNGDTALGAKYFVAEFVNTYAASWAGLLPAIMFLIAMGLAFATGTSWGTFGILIPIALGMFAETDTMFLIIVAACLAGAVFGDHVSPISDTTIMSSSGARVNHIIHVSTQMPYALTVAAVSFVCFVVAGLTKTWAIALPLGIVLTVLALFLLKKFTAKKAS